MRNIVRFRPKSFLDAARRDWQFAAFAWLLRNSGGYPKFLDTELVLPTEDYFPDRAMNGHAGVVSLFRRVREHAGMAEWPCGVEPDASAERPWLSGLNSVPVIRYRPDVHSAVALVASFSRELSRYYTETFDESVPGGSLLIEPTMDIAAVFMGFGIFMANAAAESATHPLNEGEIVHALTLFCLLKRVRPETVAPHLNPHLRKYLRLATRDLAQHESSFWRLRSVFAVTPAEADRAPGSGK
ncbi:MAG TPA: hypothetical protein VMF52_11775 [Steroidobacteraceae bacterium]|nr:hypothetical protein [Steroidobacteraceae bacterium]